MAGRPDDGTPDASSRVKGAFTALVCLAVGALLWIAPAGLDEAILPHRAVGAAFFAFGLLLAAALLFRGGMGRRLRALVVAVVTVGLAWMCGLAAGPPVLHAWKLSRDGRAAEATVVRTWVERKGRTASARCEVSFDGHRAEIARAARTGDRIAVLYLPSDPTVVAAGRPGDSFQDLATRLFGGKGLLLFGVCAIFLVSAVYAVVSLKCVLLG